MKYFSLKGILLCLCMFIGFEASAYDAYSIIDSTDVVIDTIYIYNLDVIVDTTYNRCLYYDLSEDGAEVTYVYKHTITAGTIYTSNYYGDIVIPDSVIWGGKKYCVTSISDHAFYDCEGLTSVTIPSTVKHIGELAFFQCSSLTSLSLPDSLTSIDKDAFYGCKGLTTIYIPKNVASIGEGAFWTCGNLTSITVNEENSHYDSRDGCNAIIETATNILVSGCMNSFIPEDVTEIGRYAFTNCNGLTTIRFPKLLTKIGFYSFCGCENLTSVVVPDNVTSIGSSAFRECYSIRSVTLGSGLQNIDNGAFDFIQPRSILIKCATPPTIYNYSFSNFSFERTMLYIPVGTMDLYSYTDIWYWFDNIRETAMTKKELSSWQAYTLMDAETFGFTVYDPATKSLSTVASVSSLKENNPNHCWQMIEADGIYFLYNLGAKKYVKREAGGLILTDEPQPIDVEDSDDGLIFAGQTDKRWALVCNDNLSVDTSVIDYVTGLETLSVSPLKSDGIYDLSGRCISQPRKGLYIIDGRKMVIK